MHWSEFVDGATVVKIIDGDGESEEPVAINYNTGSNTLEIVLPPEVTFIVR